MLNFGKTARLVLMAVTPVLATAQTLKMSPPVQPTPTPATGAATTPASAAKPAPQQSQPNSPRFVTSDNFYRANTNTKPQMQNGAATTPATQPKPSPQQVAPRQIAQPAITTPVPAPQPVVVQPAPTMAMAPAPAVSTSPDASTPAPEPTVTVEYAKGELTLVSNGAPLGTVLKLIATKTGAAIGLAPELQNEPVAGQIGPGTVREVVTRLLDSPKIDYIIMSAGNNPDGLQRIVVQPRRSSGQGSMAANIPAQPQNPALDENGHLPNGLTPAESTMSQDQIRENWKRIREQNIQAEILRQKQDREREQTEAAQGDPPPQQPTQPEPQPQPQPQENPQR